MSKQRTHNQIVVKKEQPPLPGGFTEIRLPEFVDAIGKMGGVRIVAFAKEPAKQEGARRSGS